MPLYQRRKAAANAGVRAALIDQFERELDLAGVAGGFADLAESQSR